MKNKNQQSLVFEGFENRHAGLDSKSVKMYVEHYKNVGFPYIQLSDEEKILEFVSLQTCYPKSLVKIGDKEGWIADSTGVTLPNSYHPHRYNVVCNDHRTAIEVFNKPHLFEKAIKKCLKMNGAISDSKLRSMLSIFEGVQVASNFPPGTARSIYEFFLPPTGGSVWDMSCGFGGRLFAAMASNYVHTYYGTDPSTKTFSGLLAMYNDLTRIVNLQSFPGSISLGKRIELANQGSEVTIPNTFGAVDLCFTSPPYFNTEKYAREETQSFLKYPYQDSWIKYFIGGTLENCMRLLKNEGRLVVNIANTNTFKNLETCFLKRADEIGFELIKTYYIFFSLMPGKGNKTKQDEQREYRTEPVFVFKIKDEVIKNEQKEK